MQAEKMRVCVASGRRTELRRNANGAIRLDLTDQRIGE